MSVLRRCARPDHGIHREDRIARICPDTTKRASHARIPPLRDIRVLRVAIAGQAFGIVHAVSIHAGIGDVRLAQIGIQRMITLALIAVPAAVRLRLRDADAAAPA